mmetsp:Transcript_19974/g.39231  ORF Transcript_19974/g.39231 Transcript_19974/m.39231 type:complete len:537 (+) Transcript_19974:184-1794(+)|eukprot:CAMPEP_0171488860 /NCGR_PEP_ID=MMETSP0958-20121227/2437_1 /TAXON_ID=87120 /ORGANISM="Aurantiochytrium limacinum, Strain ATCCMYA-1381" /LENGTH=536 /DNA_ID=CAMNT_0012022011 /DNA_START=63 /DNA_END=1673 /DNA_ORIENTATION=-
MAESSGEKNPATFADADETLEENLRKQFEALLSKDVSPEEAAELIKQERTKRRFREELRVCRMLIEAESWHDDISCNERDLRLCYAAALEGLGRREEAIRSLQKALDLHPGHRDYSLMLAKLLFKANRKEEALMFCQHVCSMSPSDATDSEEHERLVDAIADAFHLAGWIKIHADHHTAAYELWKQGHIVVPSCSVLKRQAAKRSCWDLGDQGAEEEKARTLNSSFPLDSLVGAAAMPQEFEAHYVDSTRLGCTPALSLFDPETQQNGLVFKSTTPVLTAQECANVLRCVNEFHERERGGKWSTVRHSSVPTTDIAVEDIPELRPWLRELLNSRLYPMLAKAYPKLADGTTILSPPGKDEHFRMRVHDAFIVRYDAEKDKSFSLPEHRDTSSMSFTVALNQRGEDFEGGGTWFEALGPDGQGDVVKANLGEAVAFAGPLRHAGYPITSGTRVILVLFLYVDNFQYGPLISQYLEKHGCNLCRPDTPDSNKEDEDASPEKKPSVRPSGDSPGGFVVYNQTVELVNMLNKSVTSVLDA